MNAKTIAVACDQHHFVKGVNVIPGADTYAFLFRKPDVIASLLFHAPQNFFFTLSYIQDNGTRRLDIMRAHSHSALSLRERGIIQRVRFQFKENRMSSFAYRID